MDGIVHQLERTEMTGQTAVALDAKSIDPAKVHQIIIWMLEGHSEHSIRESIVGNWPGEDAEPMLLAAFSKVNESGEISHDAVENWAFEATRFIYQKQMEIGDYAGATKSIRQIKEISASRTKQELPPKKVEHNHQHELGPVTQGSLDDQRERIAARITGLR